MIINISEMRMDEQLLDLYLEVGFLFSDDEQGDLPFYFTD